MPLSRIESTLFESVEFCLALLGTLPVPVYLVTSEDKIVTLNSPGAGNDNINISCKHNPNPGESSWELDKEQCAFCKTVTKARNSGGKFSEKSIWHSYYNGKERQLTVQIHAVLVTINGEDLTIVSVEDLTEIETLKGLLSMCVACNKIYDKNTGTWSRTDEFITDNSAAKFSHGMCPICAKKALEDI